MVPRRFIPIWLQLIDGEEEFAGSVIVATANWLSRAGATADVWTNTIGGTVAINDVFNVTRNGRTVSFTATAATVANVTAGLEAALNASEYPEFTEYTWTSTSTTVIGTADTEGIPATFTVSKSSASGTTSIAHTTTATGVNNWNDANNFDTGSVPGSGDTANVNLDLGSILDGFAQSAVDLAALNIFSAGSTSNTIGRPRTNPGGYTEDRPLDLHIEATAVKIETGSPRIKLHLEGTTTLEARRTGSGLETGIPALLLRGGDASSTFEIGDGQMGLAFFDGEALTATKVYVGQNGSCWGGGGAVATTIDTVGTLDWSGTFTTLNVGNGTAIIRGTPGATTITGTGGRIDARFGGTLGTLELRNCIFDKSNDLTPLTITSTTLYPGAQIIDPHRTITYTNKPALGAGVKQLSAA